MRERLGRVPVIIRLYVAAIRHFRSRENRKLMPVRGILLPANNHETEQRELSSRQRSEQTGSALLGDNKQKMMRNQSLSECQHVQMSSVTVVYTGFRGWGGVPGAMRATF